MTGIDQVPYLVRQLYEIVGQLEALFPKRRFTLDGHLVGSIGEVLAAYHYELDLLGASTETHDARASDGRQVQIKTTQRASIALRAEPDHLLVLRLLPDGRWEEVFNGPGDLAWQNTGKMQKNGQCAISVSRLRELMNSVSRENRLPRQVQ
jgi:hypothetical protein